MEHLCQLEWRAPYFMESLGTRWFSYLATPELHEIPWNSMELSAFSFGGTKVPWNSMEYSMEFHGAKLFFIWWYQSSMEFQGIYHGIPWSTCVIWYDALLIPWNPLELIDISFDGTKVPWNSMEYSMEFHETNSYFIWRYQFSMEFHEIFHGIPWNTCVIWNGALLIPWNHMELVHFIFGDSRVPWNIPIKSRVTWYWIKWQSESSMELRGTKWYLIWRPQSSMEFHGLFHWIVHGISWNTCVIWNAALPLAAWRFLYLTTPDFPWKSRVTWCWIKWQSQSSIEFHGTK